MHLLKHKSDFVVIVAERVLELLVVLLLLLIWTNQGQQELSRKGEEEEDQRWKLLLRCLGRRKVLKQKNRYHLHPRYFYSPPRDQTQKTQKIASLHRDSLGEVIQEEGAVVVVEEEEAVIIPVGIGDEDRGINLVVEVVAVVPGRGGTTKRTQGGETTGDSQ